MANNPYSPPTAKVAERPEMPVAPGPMPRNVKIALAALAVLQAYSIYNLHLPSLMQADAPTLLLGSVLTPQAVYLTVLASLFLRKNWARIAMILFFGFSLLALGITEYTYQNLPGNVKGQRDTAYMLITLGFLALRGGAMSLLFTRSASAWYQPRATR